MTLYKSSDASAPVLYGANGAVITVLDAVLVNSYGAKPAAGWTKPFAAANLASYRQGTPGAPQYYLKIRDDAPGVGAAKEARIRGFESMTAVTATDNAADGLDPFPTVAQDADGSIVRKSATADGTTARPWIIIGDQRTFYFCILSGDIANAYTVWMFGDIFSYKGASDTGRCMIVGRVLENSGNDAQ